MQNQEIREMLDRARQMNELARPCWEAIERFASGECICFSIPREMVLAIGARPNEVGNVSADTAYEVYVDGDKIVIGILKAPARWSATATAMSVQFRKPTATRTALTVRARITATIARCHPNEKDVPCPWQAGTGHHPP